jgi:hypothetical protein
LILTGTPEAQDLNATVILVMGGKKWYDSIHQVEAGI